MSFASGSRLGPYEVVSPLGAGGMGEVYRALDPKLGRQVALKVLPDEVARNRDRLARFEREARLLATLNHPGIAAIYGLEAAEGRPFLVLELVEGETLRERLRRGAMRVDEALATAKQLAEALEGAHRKGIIHRDLKPENVKLTPDGRARVLDFGLARALNSDGAAPGDLSQRATEAQEETAAGAILGTASYMSPEQARGQVVDQRTDIWAFGVVLFEMIAGTRLFAGATFSETLAAVLEREVDWSALPPATPPAIRRLLRRCLQRDRNRRLHDIADVRIELEEMDLEPSQSSPGRATGDDSAHPARPRVPWAWMVLSAALAIALGVALLRDAGKRTSEARVTRTLIPLPAASRGPAEDLWLAISPDGRLVAYADGQLYLRHLDRLEPTIIEGTAGATHPFFSADSRWLGFGVPGDQRLRKVPMTGGAPTVIGRIGRQAGVSWAPSGTIVTASGVTVGGLLQLPPDGETGEVLVDPDVGEGHYSFLWPQVLPGEDAILLTVAHSHMDSWSEASIGVYRRSTGELRLVLEGGSRARYSPSGHLVYMQGGTIVAVSFDLPQLRVTGTPVPMLEGVLVGGGAAGGFDLSEDGTLVYAPGEVHREGGRMLLVDRRGKTVRVLTEGLGDHHPRFSPDGTRIAYAAGEVTPDIRVLDLVRGAETAVTTTWLNGWLDWTPDGQRLLFGSNRSGYWNSHRRLADASGDIEHVLVTEHLSDWVGAVDGIALSQERPPPGHTEWDLMLRSENDSSIVRPFLATPASEWRARLSPDGAWVAYQSDESGRYEIYLRPFPEGAGQWPVSIGGGRDVRWNRNGREIFYLEGDRVMAVEVHTDGGPPRLGAPRVLFERPISDAWTGDNYDVAPDGQTLVIVERGDPTPAPEHLVLVQNFGEELKRLAPVD